jgi:peptidoglycan/xylan/chitin deacetylase (PgdA/CDA1 family)
MDAPGPAAATADPVASRPVARIHHRVTRVIAVGIAVVVVGTVVHASVTRLAAGSTSADASPGPGGVILTTAARPANADGPDPNLSVVPARLPDPFGAVALGSTQRTTDDPGIGARARVIYHVKTSQKLIALTFDDGWSPPAARLIYDTLVHQHVAATFFVNSTYVHWNPTLWRQIAAAGFVIGNHTYDHQDLTTLSPAAIVADIRKDARVFEELTGYTMSPIFRPPFGARNRVVDAAIRAAGYPTEVLWDTVSGDTGAYRSDRTQLRSAIAGLPGSIVLMHVGPASTPRILAAVIASYRARGYTFVTIPELLAAQGT